MAQILSTRIGREAYARQFNIPVENIESDETGFSMLGAINNFYSESLDESEDYQRYNDYPWKQ